MKKRVISMLLAVIMLIGSMPGIAAAADSESEALGEVDIYSGGYHMNYLSINGRARDLIYTYYNHTDRNGHIREIPAYCVNPNIKGVPQTVKKGESIRYLANEVGSDPKVIGIIASGYPTRGLNELHLENKEQAYYATKMALWCYILSSWDISNLKVNPTLSGGERTRAEKILTAARDIYRRGTAWTKVYQPSVTAQADQPSAYPVTVAGKAYYQQVFTVTSETYVQNASVSVKFTDPSAVPDGVRIVDMENRDITMLTTRHNGRTYAGQFKVLYPESVVQHGNGSVQLSLHTTVFNFGVYYAVCAEKDKYGNLQNYMCDTDPTRPMQLSTYGRYAQTDRPETDETSLKIRKVETGTGTPLSGALFEVVDPNGRTIGSFSTDSRGEILLPLTEIGSYTVCERQAPQDHLLSRTFARNVKVEYGKQSTITFENEPYGSLEVKKYSNTGVQLSGAVIRIRHIESGKVLTAETNYAGIAFFDRLSPGAYEIREDSAPQGYIRDDRVYTAAVITGETASLPIINREKPGLRILKYDSKTQTALPDITFEIFRDTRSLGQFRTDEFGEIVLKDLEPGTYTAKEVLTDPDHIINTAPQQIELSGDDGILDLIFFNAQKPGIHLVKLDTNTLVRLPNAKFRVEQVGGTFSKEYITDEHGEIDLKQLEPGSYKVTETAAPDGYLIDDAVRVIRINGNDHAEFSFTNTRKPGFRLVKLDAIARTGLPGASFRIAKIEDGTHYLDRITDSNGEISISDLEPGIYSVRELSAPNGFIRDPEEYHVELFPGKTSELVVHNDRKPSLEILKTDAITGKPLEGAAFTIRKADGYTVGTVRSGPDGTCRLDDLDPGVYEIRETSVPDGYLPDEKPQMITLVPNHPGTVHFRNYPKPDLTIRKIDSVTGGPVAGAKFHVVSGSGHSSDGAIHDLGTHITDDSGLIRLSGLKDGWYKVTETEPAPGYAIREPADQECYIDAGRGKTLTFENTPLSALIVWKFDSVTGEAISNAVFQIRYLSGESGTGGTVLGTYRTGTNGSFTATGLKAGTYVVEELSSDGDHVIDTPPQTAHISGKQQDAVQLYFGNAPKGSLLIRKIDSLTHAPLSDVEFKVTESDGTVIGDRNGLFTTGSDGTVLITGIEPGKTLVVRETRTRAGYILDDAAQTIRIQAGKTAELEFRNAPMGGLVIHKLDSVTKKPLSGVLFQIRYADGTNADRENGQLSSNGLYRTDPNGQIVLHGLTGTLVVTELKTLPGYEIDPETRTQTVVIHPGDTQELTFLNTPAGGLQIIKTDEDTGERIPGVRFEVRKMNGEIIGTYTTDRNGMILLPGLEHGWYTVTERKAADGYLPDRTPQNVCVKDGRTAVLELTNRKACSVMIHKVDADTGKGIYGVKFLLYDAGKDPIGEYTTDQDGYVYIREELNAGKYFLRELEAADGYLRDEQYRTIYVERGKCSQIRWENTAATGQIQIRKYARDDNPITGQKAGTALEGAIFEITRARSGAVVGYIVTDKHGIAASDPLPLGRYFVREVSAPAYYQCSAEKMEAEIEYPSQIIRLSAYDKSARLGVTIRKTGNLEVQPGQVMSYSFSSISNTSNVILNHFFWHDRIPTDAARAISITTGTYNQRLYYKVTFRTNLHDYRLLAGNLLTTNNYSLSLSANALGLMQGEYVTDVRFEFGTVAPGFASGMKPTMRVQVPGTVNNGYRIINRADVGGQYLSEWQTARTSWVTVVRRFHFPWLPKTGY